MRPALRLVFLLLAAGLAGCDSHWTSPSNLDDEGTVANCKIDVTGASFWRNFMPGWTTRGPDGGTPLAGVVDLTFDNSGNSNRFSVTVSIYDDDDKRYAIASVAHDTDEERRLHRDVLWDGLIDDDEVRHISVRLSEGPYLRVGARVYAVLDLEAERGGRKSIRTAKTEVRGTY